MAKDLSIGVIIGASLGKSVGRTFGSLEDRTKHARKTLSQLHIGKKAAGDVLRYRESLDKLKKKQIELGRSSPRLERGIADLTQKYRKAKQTAKQYGLSVKDIGRDHRRLTREISRTEKEMRKLERRRKIGGAVRGARGKIAGGVGAAYGASRAGGGALDFERGLVRLGTVVGNDPRKAGTVIAESGRQAMTFARKSLATEQEIIDIEYSLRSGGITDDEAARAGARIVSQVSLVTGGIPAAVGETLTKTYNNLGKTLKGTPEEQFKRVAELMTKTQFKFQIRDFSQLGDSMKYATATLKNARIPLSQGLTLIGALNSAGLEGAMAGTALTSSYSKMSKAAEKFDFRMVYFDDGGLDFIATLENMGRALGGFSSLSQEELAAIKESGGLDVLSGAAGGFKNMNQEMIDSLQKVFGQEGIRAVSLLGGQLETLANGEKDIIDSVDLIGNANQTFVDSTSGQWQRMTNNIRLVGVSLMTSLSPAIHFVAKNLADFTGWLGEVIDKAPGIGIALGGAATAYGTYRTVALGAALMTGNFGKALDIVTFKNLPKNIASLGRLIKTLATSKAGLVGLAAVAGYTIGTQLYDTLLKGTSAADMIGRSISRVLAFFGNDNAQAALDAEKKYGEIDGSGPVVRKSRGIRGRGAAKQRARLASVIKEDNHTENQINNVTPLPVAKSRGNVVNQDNRMEVQVNINQQPGADGRDAGEEFTRQLKEHQRAMESRQRGVLYDVAYAG